MDKKSVIKTKEEILNMIDMLNNDIENYQILHENGLKSKSFPRYNGWFKDSVFNV